MAAWKIVDGPREFTELAGRDIDVGWAWDIERDGEQRIVRVCVAGGRSGSSEFPEECQRAMASRGRTVVTDLLDRDDPPLTIDVTTSGLHQEQ